MGDRSNNAKASLPKSTGEGVEKKGTGFLRFMKLIPKKIRDFLCSIGAHDARGNLVISGDNKIYGEDHLYKKACRHCFRPANRKIKFRKDRGFYDL